MQRITEPEIMGEIEQAKAYDAADFSAAHNRRVEVFKELAPPRALRGEILDLGCGSGDLVFRLLSAFPEISIVGIDGSQAMIGLARDGVARRPQCKGRASFRVGTIPNDDLPQSQYTAIMSNSFLHHLHNPQSLWKTIKELTTAETFIFVSDLRRPASMEEAHQIIESLAGNEAEILKRDFFNSMCAAFEVPEVQEQLARAGITGLKVNALDDIHLVVHGFIK